MLGVKANVLEVPQANGLEEAAFKRADLSRAAFKHKPSPAERERLFEIASYIIVSLERHAIQTLIQSSEPEDTDPDLADDPEEYPTYVAHTDTLKPLSNFLMTLSFREQECLLLHYSLDVSLHKCCEIMNVDNNEISKTIMEFKRIYRYLRQNEAPIRKAFESQLSYLPYASTSDEAAIALYASFGEEVRGVDQQFKSFEELDIRIGGTLEEMSTARMADLARSCNAFDHDLRISIRELKSSCHFAQSCSTASAGVRVSGSDIATLLSLIDRTFTACQGSSILKIIGPARQNILLQLQSIGHQLVVLSDFATQNNDFFFTTQKVNTALASVARHLYKFARCFITETQAEFLLNEKNESLGNSRPELNQRSDTNGDRDL